MSCRSAMFKKLLSPVRLAITLSFAVAVLLWPCIALGQSYQTYFNDPHDPAREYVIEDAFLDLIDNATSTIDLTIYNINQQNIINKLVDWHNGSSQVARLVTNLKPDDSNYNTYIQQLIDDGISVTYDPSSTLSYNKFAVFDSTTVWTGSWNHTGSASYYQWNNAISIQNADLVSGYETEFNQMFAGTFHGSKSQVEGYFALGGGSANDFYRMSPQNSGTTTQQHIVNEIDATVSGGKIFFAIYSFTDDAVSQALQDAHDRGVTIRGIFDKGKSDEAGGEYQDLLDYGIDVFFLADDAGNPFNPYIHHKYMVINPSGTDAVTITGSANWSNVALVSASGNDENTLIIHNSGLASLYYSNWGHMDGGGAIPEPSTIILLVFGSSAAVVLRFRWMSRHH